MPAEAAPGAGALGTWAAVSRPGDTTIPGSGRTSAPPECRCVQPSCSRFCFSVCHPHDAVLSRVVRRKRSASAAHVGSRVECAREGLPSLLGVWGDRTLPMEGAMEADGIGDGGGDGIGDGSDGRPMEGAMEVHPNTFNDPMEG